MKQNMVFRLKIKHIMGQQFTRSRWTVVALTVAERRIYPKIGSHDFHDFLSHSDCLMLPRAKASRAVFSTLCDPLVVGRERAADIAVRRTKSAEDRVEIWELATLGLLKPRNSDLALSIVEQGKWCTLHYEGSTVTVKTGVQKRAVRSQYSDIGVLQYRDVGALSPSEEYEVRWYWRLFDGSRLRRHLFGTFVDTQACRLSCYVRESHVQ